MVKQCQLMEIVVLRDFNRFAGTYCISIDFQMGQKVFVECFEM
jgi:hypothetical protein